MFAGVSHHGFGRGLCRQGGGCGTQRFGQFQAAQNVAPFAFRQALQGGCLDIHRVPRRIAARGSAAGGAQQFVHAGFAAHAHQQGICDLPNLALLAADLLATVAAHIVVHAVGGAAQRQFAQRHQVALAEEVLHRRRCLVGQVNAPFLQTAQQVVGGQIDQHHLVCGVEHMVGHCLPHAYAGDAAHHVVQAFNVLHVHGGQHIDACFQQLFDVLPALGVAATRGVAVGQLVDQQKARLACQGGVEVELLNLFAFHVYRAQRQNLQPIQLVGGF